MRLRNAAFRQVRQGNRHQVAHARTELFLQGRVELPGNAVVDPLGVTVVARRDLQFHWNRQSKGAVLRLAASSGDGPHDAFAAFRAAETLFAGWLRLDPHGFTSWPRAVRIGRSSG
jgi:hypothetical protein